MSKGIKIALAVLDIIFALIAFSFGGFGVVAGILLLCAAFLISPLPQKVPSLAEQKTGLFSVLAFFAGFVFMVAGTPPQDAQQPEESLTRIAENQSSAESSEEQPEETTAEKTAEAKQSETAAETTLYEIDLGTAEFHDSDSVADRNMPQDTDSEETITTTSKTAATTTATTTTIAKTTVTTVSTTKATAAAAANLKVTSFPAIVYRNQDVTLKAVGQPNTDYTLKVYYSSGASKADGLGAKTSNSKGEVSWTWQIGGKTNPGTYRMTISGGGEKITYELVVGE